MSTQLVLRPQKRIRYYPLWHLLAEDGSVIAALSEAQLSIAGIMVDPTKAYNLQSAIIGQMEVGQIVYCRKIENNHSVMVAHHTIAKIVRVS